MKTSAPENDGIKKIGLLKRKAPSISRDSLIKTSLAYPEDSLPLVIEPAVDGLNLTAWAANNREFVEQQLSRCGAILFRDFNLKLPTEFERFILSYSGDLLEYKERSSPRKKVWGNVYTSTDYPADKSIFLHNENSYQDRWPMKIFFFCKTPAQQGGETPIADMRSVYNRIDPAIRERFEEKGWMLVRNFGEGIGIPWQVAFQTSDKSAVEEYCRRAGIKYVWRGNGRLKTYQVRRTVMTHPKSGEKVWFNHATFFHISTQEPAIRDALLSEFDEEDLPSNTYFGDGSRIEDSVLDELRSAYLSGAVRFLWQRGDLLMLDNMMVAHGREPYAGRREILVGMTEPFTGYELREGSAE